MPRILRLGLLLTLSILALTPADVLAKAGIIARLDAPLPTTAHPGEQITIGWTLTIPGGGELIGTAVVLRVYLARGGTPLDAPASEDRPRHWSASAVVPAGGIETVGIGIPGTSCTGSTCRPAIDFFTVTDPSGVAVPRPSTLPATDAIASAPRATPRSDSSPASLIAVLAVATFVLARRFRKAAPRP